MDTITFDKEKVAKLQEAYDHAVKDGVDVFIFEDKEFYREYAKYMLVYLHDKLKKNV